MHALLRACCLSKSWICTLVEEGYPPPPTPPPAHASQPHTHTLTHSLCLSLISLSPCPPSCSLSVSLSLSFSLPLPHLPPPMHQPLPPALSLCLSVCLSPPPPPPPPPPHTSLTFQLVHFSVTERHSLLQHVRLGWCLSQIAEILHYQFVSDSVSSELYIFIPLLITLTYFQGGGESSDGAGFEKSK